MSLVEAAKLLETTTDALCDWILDNPIILEARSRRDNKYYRVYPESYEQVLAAAELEIEYVVFDYPKDFDKFRKKKGTKKPQVVRSDEQTLRREHLRIPADEFRRVHKTVSDEIGGVLPETYGVKKVRRTRRNVVTAHSAIISAANDLLAENPEKYTKTNGDPKFAKLARDIDSSRKRWPQLSEIGYGTSIRTIEVKLSEFRSQLKIPKSYRK